jgi:dTDP-4-amino-4,6-dideoxygalactose transaminase
VEACGSDARDAVLRELHYAGLPASVGSCGEVYLEPYFQRHGIAPPEPLPVARQLAETSLSLPCHPTIDSDTMHAYAAAVRSMIVDTLSRMPVSSPPPLDVLRA